MSTTLAKSCSAVSTTPLKNLLPVSLTPAISPYNGFSVIAGVVDTGDKFIVDTGDKLSAVTTTLAMNLLPVTRTRTPWRWGAAKDRRKLKGINRRYAVLVCSSFGGLRGLRACEGPLRLFVAVPMTILAAVADFGGRSYFCRKLRPLS
jgi:hypothetical protein